MYADHVASLMEELRTLTKVLSDEQKQLPKYPKIRSRLNSLLTAKEQFSRSLDEVIVAQTIELGILREILMKPCLPVKPRYVSTAAHSAIEQRITVTPCPVCCNSYHCFNWMPTPCGHTYHPSCLVALVSGGESPPKCFACKEAFVNDWLETWGFPSNYLCPSCTMVCHKCNTLLA